MGNLAGAGRTAKGGITIYTQWDETIMLFELVNIRKAKSMIEGGGQSIFLKNTIILEDEGFRGFMGSKTELKQKIFL